MNPVVDTFCCSKCGNPKDSEQFYWSKGKRNAWCKPCCAAYYKTRYDANPDLFNNRNRLSAIRHPNTKREYRIKTREKSAEYYKNWRRQNSEYVRAYMRNYQRERAARDPAYKRLQRLRACLRDALTKNYKQSKIVPFIQCTVESLRARFEALFQPGMNWGNHGRTGWEIDHIKPCRLFDFADDSQVMECFHFSNLRPLWRANNLKKRGMFPYTDN